MDKKCDYCGTLFAPKRVDAKFCSDNCRKYASKGKPLDEYIAEEQAKVASIVSSGLPELDKVDRTRAFTDAEMELVRKLPRELWIAYMERPNSAITMTKEERLKHYVSKNYPTTEYVKAGQDSRRWGA